MASCSHQPSGSSNCHSQLTPCSGFDLDREFPEKMGETNVRFNSHPSKIIGKGAFSIVYQGYHIGLNASLAVKWIGEKYLRLDAGNLPMELKILQECDSINIIRLLDSYRVINDGLYLGLERAEMTLESAIIGSTNNSDEILSWVKETCDGVEYLHVKNILHRDIKPSNILLVKKDNILVAKLSDFGLSKKLSGNNLFSGTLTSGKGTFPYMAPEMLDTQTQRLVTTKAVDIFSLGMTMYFALSGGKYPFKASDDIAMKARILDKDDKPDKLPNEYFAAEDLLHKMLVKEACNRPKISIVCMHCLFWSLKKKTDFILDVARSFEDPLSDVSIVKEEMNKKYKNHFAKISPKKGKFNWLKLLNKFSNSTLLLSRKSQPGKEKCYGNHDWISQLITLFRDKYMHATDLNNAIDPNDTFTVDGKFSKEKYVLLFLKICPSFVDVVFSVVREYPLEHTAEYYTDENSNTSNLSTPSSQRQVITLSSSGSTTGTATIIKDSRIIIYEGDIISENYLRGYSDQFLNPAAVYAVSLAQHEHVETAAEKWNVLSTTQPHKKYLVSILERAKTKEHFYVATELAKITLASELQHDRAKQLVCQNKVMEYLGHVLKGVSCLHENSQVHGKIDQDHILVFGESRTKVAKLCLFSLDQPRNDEELIKGMRNDLVSYANLLEFSLSSSYGMQQSNSSDTLSYAASKDYTWDHLVRWIKSSSSSTSPTISQIANHPLFWDVSKSLHFISWFWRILSRNGKSKLDDQYAKLYKDREGVEFDWISKIDPRILLPSLTTSGNNFSGLLCQISLCSLETECVTVLKGRIKEYFIEMFPDVLIICVCAALSTGYISDRLQDSLRKFLCDQEAKQENVNLSEWTSVPPVFINI